MKKIDKDFQKLFNTSYDKSMDKYANRKLVIPLSEFEDDIYMNLESVHGLFIGGTTGSGKSIFLDNIIVRLMEKNTPDEIKFVFLDPKRMELGEYNGIAYLDLMKGRKSLSNHHKGFDLLIDLLMMIGERAGILKENQEKNIKVHNKNSLFKWPHIFIIIDESADIMQMDGAESVISKILDYGKVVGVHVILATNAYLKRFYDTKFIKHFKYRMSFDMASHEQAEYIEIDGADLLRGAGNALIKCPNDKLYEFQAPMVTDKEINDAIRKNGKKSR